MLVPKLLLETLENMGKHDFDNFQWYLSMQILDSCKPIPKAYLENASRRETVNQMTDRYGDELAVKISVEILTQLGINSVAEKLKNTYAAGSRAGSSSTTSSAVTPPTAGPTLSAQGASVIIAPTISSGSTTGNVTINLNHPARE